MKLTLSTPVSEMSQVGKTIATRLKKLGIETAKDLIFYYPFRYEDFSQVIDIDAIQAGSSATVLGKIEMISNRRSWKKKRFLTEALVSDQSGSVKVIWFNQPFLTKVLKPGDEVYLSGKVDFDRYTLQFINPIYEKVRISGDTIHTARIVPIYSTTERLTQKQIRWLIKIALQVVDQITDWLPAKVKMEAGVLSLSQALKQIHFPDNHDQSSQALRRLKFNELFLFLLQSKLVRQELKSAQAPPVVFNEEKTKDFVSLLPFVLTNDQKKACWQIIKDLTSDQPMNRLLEGDVGAGKTVVAAIAMFNAALTGYQSVLMAPTEILATQHFNNINKLLTPAGIRVSLLTHAIQQVGQQESSKSRILKQIKGGQVDIIIGTHALIQEEIEFRKLALVVVDEQHRFGVEQRKILHQKGLARNIVPHFLSMTATPIPRSLALTLYGDLDLSIIRELPKERKKIITEIIDPADRIQAYEFIRQEVLAGHQVFIVCPLIDPSDKLGVKSVSDEYEKLKEKIFPQLRIEKLHGRLKPAQKQKIMTLFLAKESDILVTTSVVEVGVDVPNATVMAIEGADRFGLAQLHQFRGRVGRGSHQSYCFLFTENTSKKTKARLEALILAKDGFEVAEKDLEFRGPGEIFGQSQSGWPQFKLATFFDQELVALAQAQAQKIIQQDPQFKKFPLLKGKIEALNKTVHLE